jgi:hypothetical protein
MYRMASIPMQAKKEVSVMKSGVGAGAVAGVVGGIVGVVFGLIGTSIKLIDAPPGSIMNVTATMIVLTIIFGAIFGWMYSRFCDLVPGKGISKGLYFGLMIWLVKDIAAGAYIALVDMATSIAIGLIYLGFFMWIAYGYVLSALYKK